MKRFLLLLAAGTAFVSPALAADVIYEEPPAPMAEAVPAGWTGFYVGIQGGGAFDPSDPEFASVQTANPGGFVAVAATPGLDEFSNNFSAESDASFLGGAHIGYDYQINQFVVGAVVDINAIDYSEQVGTVSRTANAFYDQERSIDYLATARLRAGFLVTPTALAYATGGIAYAEVDYGFSTNTAPGNLVGSSVDSDEDDFGYTVGGGMEVLVTDNVSFGAEYLYTNLGGGDSSTTLIAGPFGGGNTGGSTTFTQDEDFDFHTVTAKVSYRFN